LDFSFVSLLRTGYALRFSFFKSVGASLGVRPGENGSEGWTLDNRVFESRDLEINHGWFVQEDKWDDG